MAPKHLKQLPVTDFCQAMMDLDDVTLPKSIPNKSTKNKKQQIEVKTKKRQNLKVLNTSVSPKISEYKGWLQSGRRIKDNKSKTDDVENKIKTVNNSSKVDEKVAKQTQKTELFLKYGVHMPTYEDILKNQEKWKLYKQNLENIFQDNFEVPVHKSKNYEYEENINKPVEVLGCTHLTKHQLKSAVCNNLDYLMEISDDSRLNWKQDQNASLAAFDREQKLIIAKYIQKKMYNKALYNSQNVFKVLLPELCLKIFMDEHNMTQEEAKNYLEQRPIDE